MCSRICSRVSWASLLLELRRLKQTKVSRSDSDTRKAPSCRGAQISVLPFFRFYANFPLFLLTTSLFLCLYFLHFFSSFCPHSYFSPHLCLLRGWLLFLISWAFMCSPRVSSYLVAQCLRMLVVNWSSGWQGRLRTIFTISSLGLGQRHDGTLTGTQKHKSNTYQGGVSVVPYFSLRSCSSRQDKASGCSGAETETVLVSFFWFLSLSFEVLVTFVFEVLQDGDDGFQGDAVSQKQLPGAVLLKGLPVEWLNCGQEEWTSTWRWMMV